MTNKNGGEVENQKQKHRKWCKFLPLERIFELSANYDDIQLHTTCWFGDSFVDEKLLRGRDEVAKQTMNIFIRVAWLHLLATIELVVMVWYIGMLAVLKREKSKPA